MEDDVAIKVEHASKKYCKSLKHSMVYGIGDIGKNMFGIRADSERLRKDEFWAIDDVSFEVKKGDTIGIIGPNGSGKSTLLKMLNGIFWPDKGSIIVNGRVGSLIEVGAGFHPMLTGRENVYINAAILGMSKKDVDEKFDDIIKFADIGDFLDVPIKYYSSGMCVRLGFAVAVHSSPDILLVDEVLAVGDSNFVIKSLNAINELIRKNHMTVVYVSHSNTMIRAVCQKALYIENGVCKKFGNVEEVIQSYENDCLKKRMGPVEETKRIWSNQESEINRITLFDKDGVERNVYKIGEYIKIRVYVRSNRILENPIVQLTIFNENKACVVNQTTKTDNFVIPRISGSAHVDFIIKNIPLNSGIYSLSVKLMDENLINSIDYHKEMYKLVIEKGDKTCFDADIYLDGTWEVAAE